MRRTSASTYSGFRLSYSLILLLNVLLVCFSTFLFQHYFLSVFFHHTICLLALSREKIGMTTTVKYFFFPHFRPNKRALVKLTTAVDISN